MFSFGHAGREKLLAATIQSMYWKYSRIFERPIVVFYSQDPENVCVDSAGTRFDVLKVTSLLSSDAVSGVQFVPISLKREKSMIGDFEHDQNVDVRAAVNFLRFRVFQELKLMGFEVRIRTFK